MRVLIGLLGLFVSLGGLAQTPETSESMASSNAVGNQQSVTFVTPPVQTIDSRSDQNITTSGTTTQNVNTVASGTTRNIVQYTGSYTMKNVPSVNGPNLTTSNDTCMGSSSGSANGAGFGVSFGTTWTDEHCKRLKMSRELWNKGMKAASLAMDCMDPSARVALEITGTKCPQSMTLQERRANYGPDASAEGITASTATVSARSSDMALTGPVGAPEGATALSVTEDPRTSSLYNN